jgi:phosphoserine phosphatase RsbU/P
VDFSNLGLLLSMVEKACLVIIVFYLFSRTQLLEKILSQKPSLSAQIIFAVIFGILAIYGTSSGVQTSGAIVNIRNLGPMMAGLIGGPWVGLGAGLIGGLHRYFLGGFTCLPCGLGTIISGLAAGILFMALKGKIGIWKPIVYAFVMEIVDMLLLLVLATPTSDAIKLINVIAMPMVLGDTIGIAIFAFMLSNLKKENK